MNNLPVVSVIVTTKNEEGNLANCLESIKAQDFTASSVEIIVVDNNSTDRTKEVAMRYTEKVFNCGPERSAQRNLGIQKAEGKYILYLDADMILSRGVISESKAKIEEEGFVALYIPEEVVGKGFWIKARRFERSFYVATVIDAVRFVKKDKILEIGGFDESLTGPEDWDFDRRIRGTGKAGIIDAPIYHNEQALKLNKYLQKKIYYANSFDKYKQKWGRQDQVIRKQLGFSYRYFGVFAEHEKWKKLLRHPVLTTGMYYYRIILGFIYLKEAFFRKITK